MASPRPPTSPYPPVPPREEPPFPAAPARPRHDGWPSPRQRWLVRRRAARHARLGLPVIAAAPADRTPGTTAMETAFAVEANRVLERALCAAQPLRQRRRELQEWIVDGEARLLDAESTRDRLTPHPPRGRVRGEEHLTDAALADRVRREGEQDAARAAVDARNQRVLLTGRRAELGRTLEQLDGLVDDALVQVEAARLRLLTRLDEYVDELVRRHPEGALLGGLDWPTAFAPPPVWAQDGDLLRSMVRGRGTAGTDDDRA